MERKPVPGAVRSSPVENDHAEKDHVPAPAGHQHRRDSSSAHVVDSGGRTGFGSSGGVDHSGDGRVVHVLDVLVKGSPPPTTGDPSPGRNHVIAESSGGKGFGDGVEEDGAGRIRVALVAESLAKDSKPASPGESSKKRNSSSVEATVSVSLQSPGRGVGVHGSDDRKESTTNTSGSHGPSNPNNEGQ
jgi:hypothetical protein